MEIITSRAPPSHAPSRFATTRGGWTRAGCVCSAGPGAIVHTLYSAATSTLFLVHLTRVCQLSTTHPATCYVPRVSVLSGW